jgi:hypothetical protein
VKLGVPIPIRAERGGTSPVGSQAIVAEHTLRESITLTELLHLLWERSDFHRWSPRMRNRRHYRQVYRYVLEAAEGVQLGRNALTRHLTCQSPMCQTRHWKLKRDDNAPFAS